MEPEIVPRSQRYWNLALAFRPPQSGAPHDLILAYTRLFLGPGRPVAHPYESVYVEGRLMGAAAGQVVECYNEAGLELSTEIRELPDHVSLELAFMAHLAAEEERDPDRRAVWCDRERRFLLEHLARWLPQFCSKIERSKAHPYYREAAWEAKKLIEEDLQRLAPPLAEAATRTNSTPRISDPADRTNSRRRPPEFSLAVDVSRCTLCVLCTENCPPGALTGACTQTTLYLAFDPALCDGCRACVRLCPERAITVERGSVDVAPLSKTVGGTPAAPGRVLVTASRVVCPACHRPHIAEPWFDRLAERLGGGESVRYSLALCPLCKTNSQDGLPITVGLQGEVAASA